MGVGDFVFGDLSFLLDDEIVKGCLHPILFFGYFGIQFFFASRDSIRVSGIWMGDWRLSLYFFLISV